MSEKILTEVDETILKPIILEMNKALDSQITLVINEFKNENNIKLNSVDRKQIRDYIYNVYLFDTGKNVRLKEDLKGIDSIVDKYISTILIEDKYNESIQYMKHRSNISEKEKKNIIGSIQTRVDLLTKQNDKIIDKYRNYILDSEKSLNQLAIYYNQSTNDSKKNLIDIYKFLNYVYDKLVNYHYIAIVFDNTQENEFEWSTIAKTAIYAENFKESDDFPPFQKRSKKQKELLSDFLVENYNINIEKQEADQLAEKFYEKMAYGYNFVDLFISKNSKQKVLILQKFEYDPTNVLCPDCLDDNPGGNSYNRINFKSFECSNPNCKSRSKSGRGKRFTYLSAKLQTKKYFINPNDEISDELSKKYRKDVYEYSDNIISDIISLYSFTNNDILIYSDKDIENEINDRRIEIVRNLNINDNKIKKLNDIRIYKLLTSVVKFSKKKNREIVLGEQEIIIKNAESTGYLSELSPNQISYSVTSPPYYNAREYSQWPNLVCYYIDMLFNSKSVYDAMDSEGTYLYNIGDIVDQDNIYVSSLMSKRRQIIGLFSVLLFELSGWKTVGNIIWDKGEVQSKRNSNSDSLPFYKKPINCYEHIWVFSKGNKNYKVEQVKAFSPVIKINSKGENRAKHTAPYPIELVELLKPFIEKSGRVLDPFLGSGTTAVWCARNDLKCLGIELNKEYYNYAAERLKHDYYEISLLDNISK